MEKEESIDNIPSPLIKTSWQKLGGKSRKFHLCSLRAQKGKALIGQTNSKQGPKTEEKLESYLSTIRDESARKTLDAEALERFSYGELLHPEDVSNP